MKTLKSTFNNVHMGQLEVIRTIDIDNVRVAVPFFIGEHKFTVNGILNQQSNMFHWDTESEELLSPYFEGTGVDIIKEIENR